MITPARVLFGGAFVASVFLNVVWGTGHSLSDPVWPRQFSNHVQEHAKPVTVSPKADITQSQRTVTHAVKKAPNLRTTVKKHAQVHKKAHVSTVAVKKHPKSGKVTNLTKVTAQPTKTAKFDCTTLPHIAYQYPAKTVVNAAAEYLPKSSLSKLRYCLEKGESG